MSSRSHQTRRSRVRFSDEGQAAVDDHRTYVPKMETMMSTYEGPRFPGLHAMFKRRTTQPLNEGLESAGEHSEGKLRYETSRTVAYDGEDVDAEAGEFIKLKHRMLELQKLNSMKAS